MKFGLIMRAYAPYAWFGLAFHGDHRGPTTRSDVTSRLKAWVLFDPSAGTFEKPNAKSDESSWAGVFSGRDTAIPVTRLDSVRLGKGWVHFRMHAAASNPLVWPKGKLAPDIDLRITLTVSVGSDRLNVNAELTGDTFPNAEVMLQDEGGNRRMLFTAETSGGQHSGPFVRLPGNRNSPMNAICRSFALDDAGHFR